LSQDKTEIVSKHHLGMV